MSEQLFQSGAGTFDAQARLMMGTPFAEATVEAGIPAAADLLVEMRQLFRTVGQENNVRGAHEVRRQSCRKSVQPSYRQRIGGLVQRTLLEIHRKQ